MQKKSILSLLTVAVLIPMVSFAGMDDLPGIPISVAETIEKPVPPQGINLTPKFTIPAGAESPSPAAANSPMQTAAIMSGSREKIDSSLFETSRVGLNVIPGENMILPISVTNPNRLVTPFDEPRVTTTSSADILTNDSVVYVTPVNGDLVTMFITEKNGDQRNAISLTMVPRKIPPREVRLLLAEKKDDPQNGGGVGLAPGFSNKKASEWEKGDDYTNILRDTMRELAMGKTPQGYGLRVYNPQQDPTPRCSVDGESPFQVEPGQTLDGHNVIVVVSRLVNTTQREKRFKGASCYQPGVLAVATWPTTILPPGGQAELYTLFKRPDPAAQASTRPSLLTGGM
jgi:conjugal transfer pilus assembly protein TraK